MQQVAEALTRQGYVEDPNRRQQHGNLEANLRFLDGVDVFNNQSQILEIGSGNGDLLAYLVQADYNVRGVEIDQARIEQSKVLHGDPASGLDIVERTGIRGFIL